MLAVRALYWCLRKEAPEILYTDLKVTCTQNLSSAIQESNSLPNSIQATNVSNILFNYEGSEQPGDSSVQLATQI